MRRLIIMIVALVVTSLSAFPTLAQQGLQVEMGRYEIEVASTGKVLDLKKEDMRSVQQYFRGKVSNQQWDIQSAGGNSYYIRSVANGGYLSVENAREGGRVVVTNRSGDVWRFVPVGSGNMMIVHRSGMTLDLTGGDTRDGAPIQVWSQARNANQQFRLVQVTANASNEQNGPGRIENNAAYQRGVNDRTSNLNRDYRRHRGQYDRSSEREFEQSYNAGYDNGRANSDLNSLSVAERRVYNEGYQFGQRDASSGHTSDYGQYVDGYSRRQETIFQQGYESGYNGSRRNGQYDSNRDNRDNRDNDQFDLSRLSAYERRAYDEGYRLGQQDARAGSSLNYRRYSNRFDNQRESIFRRGYEVGYNQVRR